MHALDDLQRDQITFIKHRMKLYGSRGPYCGDLTPQLQSDHNRNRGICAWDIALTRTSWKRRHHPEKSQN
jgi:hypothetical protein